MSKKKKKQMFRIPNPKYLENQNEPHTYNNIIQLSYKWSLNHKQFIQPNNTDINTDAMLNFHKQLMLKYTNKLAEKDHYFHKNNIDQADCIDMSAFGNHKQPLTGQKPNTEDMYIILEYIKHPENNPFYYMTPCFQTGFLKINLRRGIYFKILKIEENTHTIQLHIQDIILNDNNMQHEFGRSTDVTYNYTDCNIRYITKNETSFVDMYTKLKPTDLNWNREQISFWEEVILQNAVNQNTLFEKINKNPTHELGKLFIYYILLSNYYLSQKRPVLEKKNTIQNKKIKTTTKPIDTTDTTPIKRIRHIGNIRFVSEKPPSKPNKERIYTYRMENWGVRGHIRHYKNGKTVYIQPQTRHRKSLNGHTNPKIQNILKIHNQKGGTKNEQ